MSKPIAKRFYISGIVQGVGYRFFAQRAAAKYGVCGYVKNLYDGRVEVYAIGSEEQIRLLRADLKRGPFAANVVDMAEDEVELLEEFANNFSVEHED